MKKKIVIGIGVLVIAFAGFAAYSLLAPTDPEDIMEEIVGQNPDAVISVGIWEKGQEEKYIYTAEGKQDYKAYTYQIGSITKTFTGAMAAYEEARGNLELSEGEPSLKLLMTHKSGLSDQWEQLVADDHEKSFSREEMESITADADRKKEGKFIYSNFGSGLAGTRVAQVYAADKSLADDSYQGAMEHFLKEELGLENTSVGGSGDFKYNFPWQDHDEMLGDGSMTSNVEDMLNYGRLYLADDSRYAYLKKAATPISDVDEDYDIAMFWIIEKETGIIWHNGEIEMDGPGGYAVGYQCFLGINPESEKVVVVLSNAICNGDKDTAYTDLLGYLLVSGE